MSYFCLIGCPLCYSRKFKVLHPSTLQGEHFIYKKLLSNLKNTTDDFTKHARIVRCKDCCLVYVNPVENLSLLLKAYSEVVDDEYLDMEKYRKILLDSHLQRISKYITTGKILDVGSFAGFFLELAREQNWDVYGLEPSKWANAIARKKDIKIVGNDILSAKIKTNYFDVITMWDVIEHIPHPHEVVAKIYTSLKPGGILAIGTPDIDSIFAKVLKSNCHFLIRMHIILYSAKTLRTILEQHGFKIVDISYYGRTFPISYFLKRLHSKSVVFRYISTFGQKIPFVLNLPITINFRDSIRIIARKI